MLDRVKKRIRSSRHFLRTMMGKDLRLPLELECEKQLLGNERAQWCICPAGLSPESVIYSFGVGRDISFDLELMERFGVRVHAFDPTPRSIEWVRSQTLPAGFIFHEFGVADFDGTATFHAPENPGYVSYSIFSPRGHASPAIEATVHRIPTIMKMLGHKRIDLLKMDIEGAEYTAIEDLISCRLRVDQLLVEFHHRWQELGIERTANTIRSLHRAGFKIFHVSPSGEEYSFLKL